MSLKIIFYYQIKIDFIKKKDNFVRLQLRNVKQMKFNKKKTVILNLLDSFQVKWAMRYTILFKKPP